MDVKLNHHRLEETIIHVEESSAKTHTQIGPFWVDQISRKPLMSTVLQQALIKM